MCRGEVTGKGFEAKNGKEVSCEAMVLPFPVFRSKRKDIVFAWFLWQGKSVWMI